MTLQELKYSLPNIPAIINGKESHVWLRGRKNDFCSVVIPPGDFSNEYAWETILKIINENRIFEISHVPGVAIAWGTKSI